MLFVDFFGPAEVYQRTREAIQERIWMNEEAYSNTVNVYIGLIRKKIDANHADKLIHTVHGAGYTLRAPAREEAR